MLAAPAELVLSPAAAVEPAATWADTTRLSRTLGFVPVTDLDDVVARQARVPTAAGPAGGSGPGADRLEGRRRPTVETQPVPA